MDVNPFLMDMLGYSHEKLIKKTIWEVDFFLNIIKNMDKFIELSRIKSFRSKYMEVETATKKKIDIGLVSSICFIDNRKNLQVFIHELTLQE